MKKFVYILLLAVSVFCAVMLGGCSEQKVSAADCVRIHVRADSNSDEAQAVKMKVSEKVVEYLTPVLAVCRTADEAKSAISKNLSGIEQVAVKVLKENGFDYGAKASLRSEKFPTRVYDGITFDGGVYDALIVELGSGKGDNWWCVAFPPLCFVPEQNSQNFKYRSLIVELIRKFKEEQ